MKTLVPMFILVAAAVSADSPLVAYTVVDATAIPAPLVEGAADPDRGGVLMLSAGCSACHQKDLNSVSDRLSDGEIRLMIVAPEIRVPETTMPAYYIVGEYGDAPDDLVGRTRLSAPDIEAIIAYLKTI